MYKFVRIIDCEEYEEYLNCKDYKYVPKIFIYAFRKWIKPRVICKYISQRDEEVVGYGVGVFLKEIDISKDEYKKRIIDTINKLKDQEEYKDVNYLLNENLKLDYDDISEIEKQCNVEIPSGKAIFAKNILSCLKEICEIKKENMSQKEVFIVSDNTIITEALIDELAITTKFIEVFTEDLEFGKRLEKDMFNKYGLSLHATKEIDKIYNNFDFIINLNEKPMMDISQVSKNKTIVDLSDGKILNRRPSNRTKRVIIIDDLYLKNDGSVYSENEVGELDDSLNTSTSSLINSNSENINKIQIYNKSYSLEKIGDVFNLKKTREILF